MLTLTKSQKADIVAWALNFGWNDYFDSCVWNAKAHKYRYVCAQADKVYYLTQKQLAQDFDNTLTSEEREQFTADFFDYQTNIDSGRTK